MALIESLPEANAYDTLKTRLTEALAITNDEKVAKILDTNGLGDKSPSQLASTTR